MRAFFFFFFFFFNIVTFDISHLILGKQVDITYNENIGLYISLNSKRSYLLERSSIHFY